ncbi:IS630 family transposase [Photorhabdus temperata subsp. temperata M1021]|nr:IS630 family transposase [Photorhabdus temperata subsp. temperata M1021]
MAKIIEALSTCSEKHPVFYEDEVDIELNPKIGADWYLKGQQKRIVTPGKNQKHYLAGCLNVQIGKITYVGGLNKNSRLFINVLEELERLWKSLHETVTTKKNKLIMKKQVKTLIMKSKKQ